MSTAAERRSGSAAAVQAPTIAEIVHMLVKRNPGLPRKAVAAAGRLAALLGSAALKLPPEQQRALVELKDKLPKLLAEATTAASRVEESAGEGLGSELDEAEGAARLRAYASPVRIEDWAGEVAGPGEIERRFGIGRSTLHGWQRQNAVIGLLAGTRKHIFPVAQFVDGRPVEGLARIVASAGSPRTAWLWLVEPHPSLGGAAPIARLKAGEFSAVAGLAERDFGQS